MQSDTNFHCHVYSSIPVLACNHNKSYNRMFNCALLPYKVCINHQSHCLGVYCLNDCGLATLDQKHVTSTHQGLQ